MSLPPRPDLVTAHRSELCSYIKALEQSLAEQERRHQEAVQDVTTIMEDCLPGGYRLAE